MRRDKMSIKDMLPFRKRHLTPYVGSGFHHFSEMQDRLNDVIENFFSNVPGNLSTIAESSSFLMPLMNVSENDKHVTVKVELPGINEKDITIESVSNQLIIKGHRKEDKEEKETNYYMRESSYGNFLRTVSLPFEIDISKSTATFKDGILRISIEKPKGTLSGTKTIPIQKGK